MTSLIISDFWRHDSYLNFVMIFFRDSTRRWFDFSFGMIDVDMSIEIIFRYYSEFPDLVHHNKYHWFIIVSWNHDRSLYQTRKWFFRSEYSVVFKFSKSSFAEHHYRNIDSRSCRGVFIFSTYVFYLNEKRMCHFSRIMKIIWIILHINDIK